MDRGAWQAEVIWVLTESDITKALSTTQGLAKKELLSVLVF